MATLYVIVLLTVNLLVLTTGQRNAANVCLEPPDTGSCRAFIPSFYFNTKTGSCDCFVFGGCRAGGNHFNSIQQCMSVCNVNPANQVMSSECTRILASRNPQAPPPTLQIQPVPQPIQPIQPQAPRPALIQDNLQLLQQIFNTVRQNAPLQNQQQPIQLQPQQPLRQSTVVQLQPQRAPLLQQQQVSQAVQPIRTIQATQPFGSQPQPFGSQPQPFGSQPFGSQPFGSQPQRTQQIQIQPQRIQPQPIQPQPSIQQLAPVRVTTQPFVPVFPPPLPGVNQPRPSSSTSSTFNTNISSAQERQRRQQLKQQQQLQETVRRQQQLVQEQQRQQLLQLQQQQQQLLQQQQQQQQLIQRANNIRRVGSTVFQSAGTSQGQLVVGQPVSLG